MNENIFTKVVRTPDFSPLKDLDREEDIPTCQIVISSIFSFNSGIEFYRVRSLTEIIEISFYFDLGKKIHSDDYSHLLSNSPHKIRNYYTVAEKVGGNYFQILVVEVMKFISTDIKTTIETITRVSTTHRGYVNPSQDETISFATIRSSKNEDLHRKVAANGLLELGSGSSRMLKKSKNEYYNNDVFFE